MKIAVSATNPCHLYDLAKAWHSLGALGAYHSGYPAWRLHPPKGFPLRAHSWRTLLTYAGLRLPRAIRPSDAYLFRWQDKGFDRAVAGALRPEQGTLIHAMPGQALSTFRAAKSLGIETCLNHASGPLTQQYAILQSLAERTGSASPAPPPETEIERRAEETALADWHCVASSIVREQLVRDGIPASRIWLAPYSADETVFARRPPDFAHGARLIFAGQLTPRKGLPVLVDALRHLKKIPALTLDCYGPSGADAPALQSVGDPRIRFHGAVPQRTLARRLRESDLLVLPSWEDAFGLVVPQALSCGIPAIVSDRVGAKDIIHHRRNGSVFPAGDADALAGEIAWWLGHPEAFEPGLPGWPDVSESLLRQIRNRPNLSA